MARTLPPSIETAAGLAITTPGYLVELAFSTVLRFSTRGDQSWNSLAWTGGRLGKVQVSEGGGQIELINTDLAMSALVLGEGVADVPVKVWAFYGSNPTDVVPVFDGVGDGADIGLDRVRLTLVAAGRKALYSPRRFINAASGFTQLLPAGSQITWGGETFLLERF